MDLLQHYSLSDIVFFIVFLSVAVKEFITFFDWARNCLRQAFDVEHQHLSEKERLEKRFQDNNQMIKILQESQQKSDELLKDLSDKINMLIESDRDDIKAFITEKHHYYCYQKKWIDDFSLECLEKRYKHYEEEGGNSFIGGFMQQLRNLPKQPPPIIVK